MGSRTLLNVAMLLVFAALVAIVVIEPGLDGGNAGERLTRIDRDNVERIDIEPVDKPSIALRRGDGGWKLDREPAVAASAFNIETLLALLEQNWIRSYSGSDIDPEKVGLAPPRATIRFNGETLMEFGATDALEGHRYVRIGERIYLVGDTVRAILGGDWTSFVSTRLLPEARPIEALELPGVSLRRTGGKWELVPASPDIGADAIHAMVDAWKYASALWVDALEDVGTETGDVRVILGGDSKTTITFGISAARSELVLVRPDLGVRYHFPAETRPRLLQFETEDPAPEKPATPTP